MVDLHVVPGQSAAGALRLALAESGEDLVVGLRDTLSCGPLLKTASLDAWVNARQQFWAEVLADDPAHFSNCLPDLDLLARARTLTVWLGNGLGDQIVLPWFCWLLGVLTIPSKRVRVVQFPLDFVPRHRTPSLGILTPELIRKHPPAKALDPSQADHLGAVWEALTDREPNALSTLLKGLEPSSPLRHLAFLSLRYPHASTGLNFWESKLLVKVRERGPSVASVVAYTLAGEGWDIDPVGDGWLFWRLLRLAALPEPLVEVTGGRTEIRGTNVELTTTGAAVIDHSSHALNLNPIDDWIGGVHLCSGSGGIWVNTADPCLDAVALPNNGLQLTWRSLPLPPRS